MLAKYRNFIRDFKKQGFEVGALFGSLLPLCPAPLALISACALLVVHRWCG